VSNNRNTPPAPVQQPGAAQPPSLSPKGAGDLIETDLPFEIGLTMLGDETDLMKGMIEETEENPELEN